MTFSTAFKFEWFSLEETPTERKWKVQSQRRTQFSSIFFQFHCVLQLEHTIKLQWELQCKAMSLFMYLFLQDWKYHKKYIHFPNWTHILSLSAHTEVRGGWNLRPDHSFPLTLGLGIPVRTRLGALTQGSYDASPSSRWQKNMLDHRPRCCFCLSIKTAGQGWLKVTKSKS